MFQKGVLSESPSKPEPLLAAEEVYSYSISLNPWNDGLFSQPDANSGFLAASHDARPVPTRMRNGCINTTMVEIFISRASTFLPRNSGVRPTMRPLMNTAMIRKA